LKQHLVGIRDQVAPSKAPSEEIEHIRFELQNQFDKFEENKARKKELNVEIGRKSQLAKMRASWSIANPSVDFEGSSIPSKNVRDPFRYVPPPHESQPRKKKNIRSYFTPFPTFASASQPSQTQPTLDNHWRKQYKNVVFEYTTRMWYDADIPFNVSHSPYYQHMWDSIIAAKKGFKGPNMHDLKGSLLQKEVFPIDEYFRDFKEL